MLDGVNVVNAGVSGAPIANIAGRMGGIPIVLGADVNFPAGTITQTIQKADEATYLVSSYLNRRSYLINPSGAPQLNPCYIDGHEVELRMYRPDQQDYSHDYMTITLKDVTAGDNAQVTLHSGSQFRMLGGKEAQNGVVIIMMGTNGTYTNVADYVEQCKRCAKAVASGKYLILSQFDVHFSYDGTYATYASAMAEKLSGIQAIEDACLQEFGTKFVNMRQQLVNNGLRYAVEGGYLTDEAFSKSNNIDALSHGYCPFGDDRDPADPKSNYHNGLLYDVHPNNAGNYAIARIVYEAMTALGYM